MEWQTLRNPNSLVTASTDGEWVAIPIPEDGKAAAIKGVALVKISDLTPAYPTMRAAQAAARKL